MTSDENEVNAPRVAFDMALWQLTEQQRSIEGLDSKAGNVLTASLAFLGLFALSVTFAADANVVESIVAAITSGAAVLGLSGWVLFTFRRAIEPARWVHGPEGRYLVEVATRYSEGEVSAWLVERIVDSYEENDDLLTRKTRWLERSLTALVVQGASVTAGFVTVAAIVAFA